MLDATGVVLSTARYCITISNRRSNAWVSVNDLFLKITCKDKPTLLSVAAI
jgi:hypothetical protein